MIKFKVEITETLQYQEEIEARNEHEAIQKLKEKYHNQEIILDESNHVSTEFNVIGRSKNRDEHQR